MNAFDVTFVQGFSVTNTTYSVSNHARIQSREYPKRKKRGGTKEKLKSQVVCLTSRYSNMRGLKENVTD